MNEKKTTTKKTDDLIIIIPALILLKFYNLTYSFYTNACFQDNNYASMRDKFGYVTE